MQAPRIPADEIDRLAALDIYGILDTEGEQAFDDLTFLASQICEAPMALVSLVDVGRQWFKSKIGLDVCETPRDVSFCGHAILDDQLFVVEDADHDPRFSGNPLVTGGPRIRFYVGAPLIVPGGHRIGTLCVLDHKPRSLSPQQGLALQALARQVVALLESRRKSELLERRDRRRSRLFSVVSHDLRTAFTGLIGYVGLLVDEAEAMDPEDVLRNARRARQQARHALGMAEDLLAWARAELGGLQFKPVTLDLEERIHRCVEMLSPLAEEKSIEIVVDCEAGVELQADDTLLTSMVRNLLANAIKFSPEGERVDVTTRTDGTRVIIQIRDNGDGLTEEQIEALHLGEAINTTPGTGGEKGTGLGLLTTRQFAARHGGSLTLRCEQGTIAELVLPFAKKGSGGPAVA